LGLFFPFPSFPIKDSPNDRISRPELVPKNFSFKILAFHFVGIRKKMGITINFDVLRKFKSFKIKNWIRRLKYLCFVALYYQFSPTLL